MVSVAVPFDVVATTLTAPAAWAGVVAVIVVALLTVNELAAVPPKLTAVVPVRLVPVRVTVVPPAVLPVGGVTWVRVGVAPPLTTTVYVATPLSPKFSTTDIWNV